MAFYRRRGRVCQAPQTRTTGLPVPQDQTGAPAPDRIVLRGLTVRGRHGVLEHERRDGQDFVVDAVLHLDAKHAGRTDSLADTVDYGDLAQRLAMTVGGPPFALIETLAQRLAEGCLEDPRVQRAEVTVHKPSALIPLSFEDIAVTVSRP